MAELDGEPRGIFEGEIAAYRGDARAAAAAWTAARSIVAEEARAQPENFYVLIRLAWVDACLGNTAAALDEGRRGRECRFGAFCPCPTRRAVERWRARMRPLESAVRHPRRNLRILLVVGGACALASTGVGLLLFFLGRGRADVTLTFAEFGGFVAALGLLHLGLYAGLFWQVNRLSRRPRPLPTEPASVPAAKLLE